MILVAMVALSIALLLYFIELAPKNVARQFASQLETASEKEVEEILGRLERLGSAGIPELVQSLSSSRRVVVLGSKNVLEQEFQRWTQQEIQKSAGSHYLLAKSLSENLDRFGPTSRLIAASFAQRTLRTLLVASNHDPIVKRLKTIDFCEDILQKTEGERSVAGNPVRLDEMYMIAGSGEPLLLYPPDPFDEQLILAASERNSATRPDRSRPGAPDRNNSVPGFYDPYSSPRAELLYAVHQSRLSSVMEPSLPIQAEQPVLDRLTGLERLAYQNVIDNRNLDSVDGETFQKSQVAERIASQFLPDEADKMPVVPEEEPLSPLPIYEPNPLQTGVEKTDLGKTPPEEIPNLPTSELIRLLHHPNRAVQAIAEKRLRDRERFQDEHIALAYRLHHPDVEIRKGMTDALVRVPSVYPVPWLMEMLRDNDPEVRLAAVTFIATTKDKTLFQEVLDRVKKDDDPRISGLVEKLERIQKL